MGYTHYFENIQKPEKARITRMVDRFTTAVALLPKEVDGEPLAIAPNPDAEGTLISVNGNSFVVGRNFINFEGRGPGSGGEDLSHETLDLRWGTKQSTSYCKTARKPYDLAVCVLALIARREAPRCWKIGSDGDDEDWAPARAVVEKVYTCDPAMIPTPVITEVPEPDIFWIA